MTIGEGKGRMVFQERMKEKDLHPMNLTIQRTDSNQQVFSMQYSE